MSRRNLRMSGAGHRAMRKLRAVSPRPPRLAGEGTSEQVLLPSCQRTLASRKLLEPLDSGFRRNDDRERTYLFRASLGNGLATTDTQEVHDEDHYHNQIDRYGEPNLMPEILPTIREHKTNERQLAEPSNG